MFCYVVLSILSSFAIILMGKAEWLDGIIYLMSCGGYLFCGSSFRWQGGDGLRYVIVVCPDHTQLCFFYFFIITNKHARTPVLYYLINNYGKNAFLHSSKGMAVSREHTQPGQNDLNKCFLRIIGQ